MIGPAAASATWTGIGLVPGQAVGAACVCHEAVSVARIDPATGILREPGHPLDGCCLAARVLVCPQGKGSTSGSYTLLNLKARDRAPAAIVMTQADAIVIAGAVLSAIPLVSGLDAEARNAIADGTPLRVDGATGTVSLA